MRLFTCIRNSKTLVPIELTLVGSFKEKITTLTSDSSINESSTEVTFFNHTWLQPSVITRVKGTGPNENEIVILGAHEDSIYNGARGRAPGADDDGSGTATLMEVFRVLMNSKDFRPKRTLEFHTYAGTVSLAM